jgi:hypothetical protein
MIRRTQPITGKKYKSCHHPLRSVSCKRRVATARLGRKVAKEKTAARL